MNVDFDDTIVAPATPAGEGSVSIVRLSGTRAEEFLLRTFRAGRSDHPLQSHRLYYGEFVSPVDGDAVDEVMAVLMRKPASYTREDVAEIHCHGNPVIVRHIIRCLIEIGARMARPGEFTLRAFSNGRIDLSRAEAVADFIGAKSQMASRTALQQLDGALSKFIYGLRERLLQMVALVEAYIDFPEEEIDVPHREEIHRTILGIVEEIEGVLQNFETGRILREGISILLLGRPNVGKSSLLNAFLGEARAIVTDIPGTTRDIIEESLVIGGIPLKMVDTAGVRHSLDPVEMEGVRRAREKARSADITLVVLDGSQPPNNEDFAVLDDARESKVIVVQNKADKGYHSLPEPFSALPHVAVSALEGSGLGDLTNMILTNMVDQGHSNFGEAPILSDQRHQYALLRAKESLLSLLDGLKCDLSPEFLALEIKGALESLGEITGETTPDEILEHIFTRFCIGK